MRGHSSFFVHFFFTALVLAAGFALRCTPTQWCLLLGCIGLVLTAELFNSAVETLFRGLDEQAQARTSMPASGACVFSSRTWPVRLAAAAGNASRSAAATGRSMDPTAYRKDRGSRQRPNARNASDIRPMITRRPSSPPA